MRRVIESLRIDLPVAEIVAVGHRVVHGGPDRDAPPTLMMRCWRNWRAMPLRPAASAT
ncbi:hypothetical protein ACFSHQ_09385 [Gemmobacter lanyuensis]